MYWWNVSKLAEDLRERRVEEKERFKYYIAFIVLYGVTLELANYFPVPFNMARLIYSAATLIIIITGTILCHRANRSGDNADFIGRMICLGWPIFVKLLVLSIVIFFGFEIVGKAMGGTSQQIHTALDIVPVPVVLTILNYWLLHKYVRLVAHPMKALEKPI